MSKGEGSKSTSGQKTTGGDGVSAVSPTLSSIKKPQSVDVTDVGSAQVSRESGFFAKTRLFGAWITKATDGDKINVSSQDINTIAPSSF